MKIEGQIVDIHSRTVYGGIILISEGKIVSIEKAETKNMNFILPGFIDAHVHIESSMVTPSQFAVTAVKHGTVAVVSDPHEIANVMGLPGIEFMIHDAEKVPLQFLFGAPSCVPATQYETSGATISALETEKLLNNPKIGYLAEMMNFPGVIYNDREVIDKLNAAKKAGKVIDGHAPGLTGEALISYINAGISTDHECSTIEEAKEKIDLGMNILIREGSAAKNLNALRDLFKSNPDKIMLCSDDLHPEMLENGHINLLVAKLINEGYDLFDVLRSVSVNPCNHYDLNTGLLRVGDNADFIVTDDLKTMKIIQTWLHGECVYEKGMTSFSAGKTVAINRFNSSPLTENDLKIIRKGNHFKVIKAFNGDLFTDMFISEAAEGDFIESNTEADILKIVVKDRYNDNVPAIAFINGFGLREGAFATSVAHDSHNIIAIGTSDKFISEAMNMVVEMKGGMAVVNREKKKILPLPVAGIMSDRPVETVAADYQSLSEMAKKLGCKMDAPFMTLSFMALLVIPKLKIGDKGLFDVSSFSPTSLFID